MTYLETKAAPPAPAAPHYPGAVQDFAQSEMFQRLFDEGMALVEKTAAYLDGPGRRESQAMRRELALAYAGESMRLTTRLMQVASWLLLQKAIREYEISPEQAADEKYRLGAQDICRGRPLDLAHRLPPELIDLLLASESIYERVDRLDRALFLNEPIRDPRSGGGVLDQRDRLRAAFEAG
jgi:regulator of CtrA degradation